jgi:hypothetical protein
MTLGIQEAMGFSCVLAVRCGELVDVNYPDRSH